MPIKLWTLSWRLWPKMFEVCSLIVVDCGTFGAKIETSNNSRDRVGCGVVSVQSFDAEEVVWYYYGRLVYSNLTTEKRVRERCGDVGLFIAVDDFLHERSKLPETFLAHAGKKRSAWKVSACLCCTQFTSDSGFLPGDTVTEIHRRMQPGENNISFLQLSSQQRVRTKRLLDNCS